MKLSVKNRMTFATRLQQLLEEAEETGDDWDQSKCMGYEAAIEDVFGFEGLMDVMEEIDARMVIAEMQGVQK